MVKWVTELLLVLLLLAACVGEVGGRGELTSHQTVVFLSRETSGGRAAAQMAIEPSLVAPGETPTATVSNEGEVEIGYGNPFQLFMRSGDDWELVPNQTLFTLELQQMRPGEMKKQRISVHDESGNEVRLRPGVYRYAKDLFIEGLASRDEKVTLRATFRVEPGRE
jgi:hypothetical protein